MGLLAGLLRPRTAAPTPPPDADFWYEPRDDGPTAAGVCVTPDSALRVASVFACVRLLGNTIGSLPMFVYERMERGKRKATEHPLYGLLRDRPNDWQTPFEFRQMMQSHLCLRGNAYARILPGVRGAVDQLIPLHPDRVDVFRLDNGRLGYTLGRPDSPARERLTQDEVFHLRGFSLDGIRGLSPISLLRETVGSSMAAQSYGGTLFRNNARPAGALKTPNKLSREAKENLRATWYAAHGGPANAGRVAVLEEGLDWADIGMSNEDAQWIDFLKLGASDVAMIFGVPPHLIGMVEKTTSWGAGIEEQGIGFVVYTLDSWLTLWEQACDRDLLADPETYYCKFLLNKLLRGDVGRRYAAYAVGRQWGWLSVNDVRELEDMNPVEGGDEYMVPLNMEPAGSQDMPAAEDPPAGYRPPAKDRRTGRRRRRSSGAGAALAPLLADAAERIASAEVRGLRARAGRAREDPARFLAWLETEHYAKHERYVERTLRPLADAARLAGGEAPDPAAIASGWRESAVRELCAADPEAVVAGWESSRAGALLAALEAAFGGGGA